MASFDVAIIGAGLVGLGTAYALSRRSPGCRIAVIEKEAIVGAHQSSHNSGVLHSGIYYKPGSLKAKNCLRGIRLLEEFATAHAIPFRRSGKMIVACSADEEEKLVTLAERAAAHQIPVSLLTREQMIEREPAVGGTKGLWVHTTGVIDYPQVAATLRTVLEKRGVAFQLSTALTEVRAEHPGLRLITSKGDMETRLLINCAGLYSDRVARLCGVTPAVQIVPFRGEYWHLKPEAAHLCRSLIYPVPDPRFPFLGVHVTRGINDLVELGPNAVLATSRQGYRLSQVNLRDLGEMLTFSGTYRFIRRYWREGLRELERSLRKQLFLRSAQKLVPDLRDSMLERGGSGVRAQAMRRDGALEDDFLIQQAPRSIHVLNAPSPAATSCLSIGETIVDVATAQENQPAALRAAKAGEAITRGN